MKATKVSNIKGGKSQLTRFRTYREFETQDAMLNFISRETWRETLVEAIDEWSRRNDALEMNQFCMEYNIPRTTLYQWREAYPEIDRAIDKAKLALATRRRVGALTKKFDKDMVNRDIHRYDPEEHKEVNVYHAELRKQDDDKNLILKIDYQRPAVITQEEMQKKKEE